MVLTIKKTFTEEDHMVLTINDVSIYGPNRKIFFIEERYTILYAY